jgi:hypothetical protein
MEPGLDHGCGLEGVQGFTAQTKPPHLTLVPLSLLNNKGEQGFENKATNQHTTSCLVSWTPTTPSCTAILLLLLKGHSMPANP